LQADAIRVKVGYPLSPNTDSSRSIALYYRLVLVDKAEFFESILSSRCVIDLLFRVVNIRESDELQTNSISDVYKKWQTLGKLRDNDAWLMVPSEVNAYFNPPANEVSKIS
jgi:endothelin-converting enzyme